MFSTPPTPQELFLPPRTSSKLPYLLNTRLRNCYSTFQSHLYLPSAQLVSTAAAQQQIPFQFTSLPQTNSHTTTHPLAAPPHAPTIRTSEVVNTFSYHTSHTISPSDLSAHARSWRPKTKAKQKTHRPTQPPKPAASSNQPHPSTCATFCAKNTPRKKKPSKNCATAQNSTMWRGK
jgi:hypothetical protein